MLIRLALLGGLIGAKVLVDALSPPTFDGGASAALAFGFVLLAADLAGALCAALRLPRISGYIAAGLALGPEALRLLSQEDVGQLKLIDQIALTFIALALGAELDIGELRRRLRSIAGIVLVGGATAFMATAAVARLAWPIVAHGEALARGGPGVPLAASLFLGVLALPASPTAAIAVIRETRSRGPAAEAILGATIVFDVGVLIAFAVVASLVEPQLTPEAGFDIGFAAGVFAELAASVAAGIGIAWALSIYIARSGRDLSLVILAVAFLVARLSPGVEAFFAHRFGLTLEPEPLLVCVAAGFALRNIFAAGAPLARAVDRIALPVFVTFFAVAGADLDLGGLGRAGLAAVLLVLVRAASLNAGCRLGGRLAGDPPAFRGRSGLAFLAQAGISLAIASEIARRFPPWGAELRMLSMTIIALNTLIGPVALRIALVGLRGKEVSAP